ncbi:uncharacterized protein Z519_09847 [Cladophialophora bantiana CBS 173.52]|uniref:Swi5-domain-containing protein n=1 Tax=Cladophialophora bantiana (strain ATCC 10958 / CBS 173.52 / CDC B-1940 / NIH 8579) TaxID=1442370 RepID=A0A0D2EHY0_CLAB1|nr:uncharacterized protein Z519_09847 [Cladophialophora bantiana CBS 173.52]KIW89691.1 hypothetical protein Z519_09847 [Cladophialophora bantiana CBS 173.52]
MEDNASLGSQSLVPQLPDSTHDRSRSSQPPKAGVQSTTTDPTSPLQSSRSPEPASRVRQRKLLASIETLKSNISTTEAQLSSKLREITQLKSFPRSNSYNSTEPVLCSSPQDSAPVTAPDQQGSSLTGSISGETEKVALSHAQSIINRHISLLKSYNEIKDIAMGMLDLIAEREGRRLKDVMDERGVDERD